jgi:8-oxo-dGTP pyrophosphatase MutT (NUDIX family)
LDEGESIESCALREVREETGLSPVLTGKMAGITYHDYFDKWSKEDVTKETHWYGMKADGTQQLVPQTEEDITEIKWVPEKEVAKYLKESYPSIVEIITKWRKEGE